MKRIIQWSLLLSIITLMASACYYDLRVKERPEWQEILDQHDMQGGFELYDNNTEIATYLSKEACSERNVPGNSFHIVASLIGLEKSTILDEAKPIYWVSKLQDSSIDASLNLRDYFQQQHEGFFAALMEEMGTANIQWGMDTLKYGNMQINDGAFWKDGTLRISLDEQLGIMKRLYFKEVKGVSGRVQTILMSMLLKKQTDKLKLYYDISTAVENDTMYHWVIGVLENYNVVKNPKTELIEKKVHPYFFALHVSSKSGKKLTREQCLEAVNALLRDYNLTVE